jgi:hypothetical protein
VSDSAIVSKIERHTTEIGFADGHYVWPGSAVRHPEYAALVIQKVAGHSWAVDIAASQSERARRHTMHRSGLEWICRNSQIFGKEHVAKIGGFLDPLDVIDQL